MSGAEVGYRCYLELGGIINETDFRSAIGRMPDMCRIIVFENSGSIQSRVGQVREIAKYSGIELRGPEYILDPRIVLYVILRGDTRPEGVKYHHGQMSDQRIFGEVLRMLGDVDSFDKLVKAHPHISFEYKRG
ncbi:MAG: hypothetical protein HYT67_01900 [Candidatus Yanofskybacteria bacterium]|nr:hypothetical protein [Candidatus Yanofskybacteria bacterium]